jgi:hypothetical protein
VTIVFTRPGRKKKKTFYVNGLANILFFFFFCGARISLPAMASPMYQNLGIRLLKTTNQ